MEIKEILKKVDHTLLKPEADWPQIKTLCDEGIRYGVASVCIPPRFVRQAKEYVGNSLKICTVAGFPNGYNSSEVKAFETKSALADGRGRNRYGHRGRSFEGGKYRVCGTGGPRADENLSRGGKNH